MITSNNPAVYGNVYYQSSREGQNQMFRVRTGIYTTGTSSFRCDRWAVRITINGTVIVQNGQIRGVSCDLWGNNVVYYYPSSSGWTNWYSYNDTKLLVQQRHHLIIMIPVMILMSHIYLVHKEIMTIIQLII
jgi:hypothetical protein